MIHWNYASLFLHAQTLRSLLLVHFHYRDRIWTRKRWTRHPTTLVKVKNRADCLIFSPLSRFGKCARIFFRNLKSIEITNGELDSPSFICAMFDRCSKTCSPCNMSFNVPITWSCCFLFALMVAMYPPPYLPLSLCGVPRHSNCPETMIASLPQRTSHSSIECEVITIPCPSLTIWSTTSHKNLLAFGSTPAVGSSRRITSGSPVIAIAVESFRLFPPEYSPAGMSLERGWKLV